MRGVFFRAHQRQGGHRELPEWVPEVRPASCGDSFWRTLPEGVWIEQEGTGWSVRPGNSENGVSAKACQAQRDSWAGAPSCPPARFLYSVGWYCLHNRV